MYVLTWVSIRKLFTSHTHFVKINRTDTTGTIIYVVIGCLLMLMLLVAVAIVLFKRRGTCIKLWRKITKKSDTNSVHRSVSPTANQDKSVAIDNATLMVTYKVANDMNDIE
jgi:hypothetical protein